MLTNERPLPPPTANHPSAAFERLLTVLNTLRIECPWDRKQTMESLRHLTIEEMYELADAILDGDLEEVKKELGDLMMHLAFYARIAEEQNAFTITDVLNAVCDKLITRHPHVYGDVAANDEEAVKRNWEQIKLKEGNKSVLSGVPRSLPAMVKSFRIQDKVRGVGFDFADTTQVWSKVEEELNEFKVALQDVISPNAPNHEDSYNPDQPILTGSDAEAEFGDLLFSLINYARHVGINPENALERTNKKFIQRFTYLEEEVAKKGLNLRDLSLDEMDIYWNEAKQKGS